MLVFGDDCRDYLPVEILSGETRSVVGAMTGTSIDGIDLALVRIDGRGPEMCPRLVRHISRSLGELAEGLRRLAEQNPMSAGEIARLALGFGELHAEAIGDLIGTGEGLDLIAVHGQTVYHNPPVSWQLINPAPIARRFGRPVVFDLRQADLAAGGRGAPITPFADWILYRHAARRRAIVNLGGFCNITILPAAGRGGEGLAASSLAGIAAFDACACNHLLNLVARESLGQPFDEGGQAALAGSVNRSLADTLAGILRNQTAAGRSLGTGDELIEWLRPQLHLLDSPDLAASVSSAIGRAIADGVCSHNIDEVILAGGGARNQAVILALTESCNAEVIASDALGIPIEAREAAEVAILGALCADGVPITLPQVTGCSDPAPIAGVWCKAP